MMDWDISRDGVGTFGMVSSVVLNREIDMSKVNV